MEWIVIFFMVGGQPTIDDGWAPMQVEDCAYARAMVQAQLHDVPNAIVGCTKGLTPPELQAIIDNHGEAV